MYVRLNLNLTLSGLTVTKNDDINIIINTEQQEYNNIYNKYYNKKRYFSYCNIILHMHKRKFCATFIGRIRKRHYTIENLPKHIQESRARTSPNFVFEFWRAF